MISICTNDLHRQLCCGIIGCWLTDPVRAAPSRFLAFTDELQLNKWLGRRGTIFVTATISFLACIWQGVTNSWPHLFIARFVLGFGIGPKSATVPVYSAEYVPCIRHVLLADSLSTRCAPPLIRGALVMMWQTWTAFGIMLGYVMDIAFQKVSDTHNITGLNWRLMLGSVSSRYVSTLDACSV